MSKVVRIGGASGFWGDSAVGAPQLVRSGQIDYLVFDYLAELTMSLLAGARLKKPELGYATDFVTVAMKQVLREVVDKGIRVVSNAGGVNPQGCADALAALAAEQGVSLKIAVVTGDDLMPQLPSLREAQPPVRELQSGAPLPEKLVSANAYMGALPVKAALDAGAQVVITGRCVDSAVTLGVLMHEFGWTPEQHDLLAAGSLAGHIIECGAQGTGGLHTDWDRVPDWAHIGYPIVECEADGSFTVTLTGISARYTDGNGRTVDCLVETCYVITMAAHGVADRSQDTFTPIAFRGGTAPPPAPDRTARPLGPSSRPGRARSAPPARPGTDRDGLSSPRGSP